MSAIFRAEINNLMRLVASAEREQIAGEAERERIKAHVEQRVKKLHAVCGRLSKSNKSEILRAVERFARPHTPISANKVAEITGISDDTTRKHLKDLASLGKIVAVANASGKQTRYYRSRT